MKILRKLKSLFSWGLLLFRKIFTRVIRWGWRLTPASIKKYFQHNKIEQIWTDHVATIYPIEIPNIEFKSGQDLILLELPQRYMPLRPNGLGYVHNIVKKMDIKSQTVDANIIMYHRFHSNRVLNRLSKITTRSGYVLPADPWETVSYGEWNNPEMIAYFRPQIDEIINGLVKARPRIIGFPLSETNQTVVTEVIKGVRKRYPEAIILVGGYSCVYYYVAPFKFKEYDYMVIGEAELTLEPLLKAILNGEKPKDLPGVITKNDTPRRTWVPAPIIQDLDSLDFPHYEWADINLYRSFIGANTVPVISSRGCVWSKCRFCCECFNWRPRTPVKVADEIEWFAKQGISHFHFNESDFNGSPDNSIKLCDEIINRGLKISFGGEMRIHKRSNREFFDKLHKAGCGAMVFGVDGWSDNVLKLQRKGYNWAMVEQNLRDCHDAGIYSLVNMVIGVPGETEDDVTDCINNFIECKDFIGSVQNLNLLSLAAGSDYYLHPEEYDIHFRVDKEKIYQEHPEAIPTDLWYSENPYIDLQVRVNRLKRIHTALYEAGYNVGKYAEYQVERDTK